MFAGFNKSGLEKEEKATCCLHTHIHLRSRFISLQVFPPQGELARSPISISLIAIISIPFPKWKYFFLNLLSHYSSKGNSILSPFEVH